jgi:hypothetical protein
VLQIKRCFALLLPLLLAGAAARAEDTPARAGWDAEAAERELELWRHERLMATRGRADAVLDPFATDGCSGGLSAAWAYAARLAPELARRHGERPPWEACCVAHDRGYHTGGGSGADAPAGARESFERRKRADLDLRACVLASRDAQAAVLAEEYGLDEAAQQTLYEAIAEIMYRAVRLGGVPCSSLPWRWGYGWPDCD